MSWLTDEFGDTTKRLTTGKRLPPDPYTLRIRNSPYLQAGSGGINLNLPTSFSDRRSDIAGAIRALSGNVDSSISRLEGQVPALQSRLEAARGGNRFLDMMTRPVAERAAETTARLRANLGRRGVVGSIADNQVEASELAGARALSDATAQAERVQADFERTFLNDILNVENAIASRIQAREGLLGTESQLNAQDLAQTLAEMNLSLSAQNAILQSSIVEDVEEKTTEAGLGRLLQSAGLLADNDVVSGAAKAVLKKLGLAGQDIQDVADAVTTALPASQAIRRMALPASRAVTTAATGPLAGVAESSILGGTAADAAGILGAEAGLINSPAMGGPGFSIAGDAGLVGQGTGLGPALGALAPLAIAGIAGSAFAGKKSARNKRQAMWDAVGQAITKAPRDAQGNALVEVGGKTYRMDASAARPYGFGTFRMANGNFLRIGNTPKDVKIWTPEQARLAFQPTQAEKITKGLIGSSNLNSKKAKETLKNVKAALSSKSAPLTAKQAQLRENLFFDESP